MWPTTRREYAKLFISLIKESSHREEKRQQQDQTIRGHYEVRFKNDRLTSGHKNLTLLEQLSNKVRSSWPRVGWSFFNLSIAWGTNNQSIYDRTHRCSCPYRCAVQPFCRSNVYHPIERPTKHHIAMANYSNEANERTMETQHGDSRMTVEAKKKSPWLCWNHFQTKTRLFLLGVGWSFFNHSVAVAFHVDEKEERRRRSNVYHSIERPTKLHITMTSYSSGAKRYERTMTRRQCDSRMTV